MNVLSTIASGETRRHQVVRKNDSRIVNRHIVTRTTSRPGRQLIDSPVYQCRTRKIRVHCPCKTLVFEFLTSCDSGTVFRALRSLNLPTLPHSPDMLTIASRPASH